MIEGCRTALASQGDRVSFREGDVLDLPFDDEIDLVFSTATFHWVLDHDRLFRSLGRALRSGGRIEAQCGGEGNLRATLAQSAEVLGELGLQQALAGERYPAYFAPVEATRERLAAAGFVDLEVWLEDAPTPFPDRATFRAFLEKVVLRTVVAQLAPADAERYLDSVVAARERTSGWQLDYVRLNLRASRGPRR
jgi:trans-aconitate 2-methyltransferase